MRQPTECAATKCACPLLVVPGVNQNNPSIGARTVPDAMQVEIMNAVRWATGRVVRSKS